MKLFIVLLLSLTAWIYPIKVVSAQFEQPKPNEQVLRNNPQPTTVETLRPKDITISQSRPTINNDSSIQFSGRHYSKEEVIDLIRQYSQQYGIDPTTPLRIANCESGYNQFAANSHSTAKGVFQFLDGTWATKPLAKDHSVFDADANVHTAIWLMSLGKYSMWQCK